MDEITGNSLSAQTKKVVGQKAAEFVARNLQSVLEEKGHANLILATGASQLTFLKAFKAIGSLNWSRITVFNLDEYIDFIFDSIEDIPKQALSLTIPAIMESEIISCVVPDSRKSNAVSNSLFGPVTTDCPASILRTHPNATPFLDENSASGLKNENSS